MLVGTPPQLVGLTFDTGSSDIWVNLYGSQLCETGVCVPDGEFDPSRSQSIHPVNHEFALTYEDGSQAMGDYVTDSIGFAHQTLENVQIGLATKSALARGTFGIGYGLNQAGVTKDGTQLREPHATIFDLLLKRESIKIKAVSFWQDDLSSGQVLFGGIDTAKFDGDLITLPIVKQAGKYIQLWVTLTDIKFSDGTKSQGQKSNPKRPSTIALVDTGSQSTYFPAPLAYEIWSLLEIKPGEIGHNGFPRIDCAVAQSAATVDLIFGSATIPIPLSALIRSISGGCELGVRPTLENLPANVGILGINILSSLYVVLDMTHNQISLAATRKVTDSNIVEYSQYRQEKGIGKENKNLDSYDSEDVAGNGNLAFDFGLNNFSPDSNGQAPSAETNALVPVQNPLISTDLGSSLTKSDSLAFPGSPSGAATLNPLSAGPDGFVYLQIPGNSAESTISPTSPDTLAVTQNPANPGALNPPFADAAILKPANVNQFSAAQYPPDHNGFVPPSSTIDLAVASSVPDPTFVGGSMVFEGGQDWLQGLSGDNLFSSGDLPA